MPDLPSVQPVDQSVSGHSPAEVIVWLVRPDRLMSKFLRFYVIANRKTQPPRAFGVDGVWAVEWRGEK